LRDRSTNLWHRIFAQFGIPFIATLCIGALLISLFVLTSENPASDFVQQKILSLRYRALEYLPRPAQPEFAPTPNAVIALGSQMQMPSPLPKAPNRTATPMPTRMPTVNLTPIQPAVALKGIKHDWQRWNNCGPATLGMYLGYYGRSDKQSEIAAFVKPNPNDKNVRPDELAAYAERVGTRAIFRENGTIERLKLILSNGLPVMIETGFVPKDKDWMGHYKLLIGYDDTLREFTLMDSYNGPNVKVSFDAVDADWRAFNRLYLIVYPADREPLVRVIVGDDLDDQTMYAQAVARARAEIEANPDDAIAHFNLGTSLNGLQQYDEAAMIFDHARALGLPWRMMWYQFGAYEAYVQTKRYADVITLADATLRTANDLEEAHYYKGVALRALGQNDQARREFETALRYNKNYQDALRALEISVQ